MRKLFIDAKYFANVIYDYVVTSQSFTHIWVIAISNYISQRTGWELHECVEEDLILVSSSFKAFSTNTVHWSTAPGLCSLSGSTSIISLVFFGMIIPFWKNEEPVCVDGNSSSIFGLSHISTTLLGRIVDFPVWHGTRGLFFRKLQCVGYKDGLQKLSSTLTDYDGTLPTRLSIFATASPQHQRTGTPGLHYPECLGERRRGLQQMEFSV